MPLSAFIRESVPMLQITSFWDYLRSATYHRPSRESLRFVSLCASIQMGFSRFVLILTTSRPHRRRLQLLINQLRMCLPVLISMMSIQIQGRLKPPWNLRKFIVKKMKLKWGKKEIRGRKESAGNGLSTKNCATSSEKTSRNSFRTTTMNFDGLYVSFLFKQIRQCPQLDPISHCLMMKITRMITMMVMMMTRMMMKIMKTIMTLQLHLFLILLCNDKIAHKITHLHMIYETNVL
mmetsp:Transcript_10032/g.11979  ORF Transcript_10032/g.11979 Transcript_10032/m.11979 type:complete len:235 (-) Transcript_10032:313-1017(-)